MDAIRARVPARQQLSFQRVLLPARATAARFERAFGARLGSYRAFGQELLAPRSPLNVPRSVSRLVRGKVRRGYDDITGLGSPSVPVLAKRLRRMSG